MGQAESKKGFDRERLKGKPAEYSPKQIRECHGEVVEHPCVEKEQPAS